MNIIGTDIRLRREEMGISLRSFAQGVGISAGYLSQLERGQQFPSLDMVGNIYRFLTKDTDDRLDNTIFDYPGILLLLQRYEDISVAKGPDIAKYAIVMYVTALYIGLKNYNVKLRPDSYFFKSQEVKTLELLHIPDRVSALEDIIHQLVHEITTVRYNLDAEPQEQQIDIQIAISDLINKGHKISDIAQKSQLTENYIQQILNNNRNPSIKTKQQLIKALQLDFTTPKTYGIPQEYIDSGIVKHIIDTTLDVKTNAPNYAEFIIDFATQYVIDNIADTSLTNTYPDLFCARLTVDCFSEMIFLTHIDDGGDENKAARIKEWLKN